MSNIDKEAESYIAELATFFKNPEDKKFHLNAFKKGWSFGSYNAVMVLAKALTDYDKTNPEYKKNLRSTEKRFLKILRESK
jgi:hypothetical protein